jgi:hypothetical protein
MFELGPTNGRYYHIVARNYILAKKTSPQVLGKKPHYHTELELADRGVELGRY